MKASWFTRLTEIIGLRRSARALPVRPAWFDDTYLSERPLDPRPPAGRACDERERAAVWEKGRPIVGWDAGDWRVDHLGNPMFRHHYGDSDSAFGWHIVPVRDGDDLANLRPQLFRPICAAAPRPERALDFDRFLR